MVEKPYKDLDEVKAVARQTVEHDHDGRHVSASVPGQSRPHKPGERAEVVDEVLGDPRVTEAEDVTVAVPTGDVDALARVREKLEEQSTRPAGATVIVEGRSTGRPTGDEDDQSRTDTS
jgi:hypothetical protein